MADAGAFNTPPPGYVAYREERRRAYSRFAIASLVASVLGVMAALLYAGAYAFQRQAVDAFFSGTGSLNTVRTGDRLLQVARNVTWGVTLVWTVSTIAWSRRSYALLGIPDTDLIDRRKQMTAALKSDPATWLRFQRWIIACWVTIILGLLARFLLPTTSGAGTQAKLDSILRRGIIVNLIFAAGYVVVAITGWKAKTSVEALAAR